MKKVLFNIFEKQKVKYTNFSTEVPEEKTEEVEPVEYFNLIGEHFFIWSILKHEKSYKAFLQQRSI